MPIKIPDYLPARSVLEKEGVQVISQDDALHQDIRPLKIGLLNLMPNKIPTETQFARLCGATPLQVELTLLKMDNHISKNTPQKHMETFYRKISEIRGEKFDGMIVTGAPVEHLDFAEVTYWQELQAFFEWTLSHVHQTFCVCWGAQAALFHHHQVPKHMLSEKVSGIFEHDVCVSSAPSLRGFCDRVFVPVSRWSETRISDLPQNKGLSVLLNSQEAGLCLVEDAPKRTFYMLNHLEYDTTTLKDEYERDLNAGKSPNIPQNYFPGENPKNFPKNSWRSHAHLLFYNWINQIYQTTPFDTNQIGKDTP